MKFKVENDNTVKAYKHTVNYVYINNNITIHTDNTIPYKDMVDRDKDYTNFSTTDITLTEEQQERLDAINATKDIRQDGEMRTGDLSYLQTFILDGYISKEAPKYMQDLLEQEKYQDQSRSYVLNSIDEFLKNKRKERENGGVRFKDFLASTDEKSRLTITALIVSVGQGLLDSVDYKFEDGFATLNATEIMELSKVMLAHNQLCFTAEKICAETIAKYSLEELRSLETKYAVNDMFDNVYRELYLQLLAK